jgi:tetratricopeptide (TPR) repeat protein
MQAGFFTRMIAKYYILFLFVCLITSCGVDSYLVTTKNHAPELTLHGDSARILVVNTFDFGRLGLKSQKKLDVIINGGYTSVNYAAARLKTLKGLTVINLTDTNHTVIAVDSIHKLIERYHADYILALDYFNAGFDAENFQDHVDESNKNKTYKTADYSLKVAANYNLYDSGGNVYKHLNGSASDYKTTQQIPGTLLVGLFAPGIRSNASNVDLSGIHATDDALRVLFAYTTTKNRALYNNDELGEAVAEIRSNNFSKADSLLKPLIAGQDKRLAAKAAYNLAVVYEAQGNIKAAVAMAQTSLDKNDNNKARVLLDEIYVPKTVSP